MDRDNGVRLRLSRRRVLAFGAASVAAVALAACGSSTATATPRAGNAPGGLAGTVQAAASAVPAGAASTAQAIASAVPGGAAAVASQGPAANTADVASRNNKYKSPPPMTIDKAKKYTATITTNKGTMKADLFVDTAPITVNNFVFLANDHFYDGVIFHRIVAGFVIQGGDPTGTGMGGPGYKFPDEPSSFTRNYEKGTLAMANSGPNTNGSQFFICVDNLTAKGALPKQYTIFGKVTEGLDVIDKILAVPRTAGSDGAQSKPTEKVFMESVTIQTQ
ncbi:MAG: peptidylprolyl isomerase [Chloroflexota bacterium]|nr:peptidylprolyl isomerase [Chloroflexota bacterium]